MKSIFINFKPKNNKYIKETEAERKERIRMYPCTRTKVIPNKKHYNRKRDKHIGGI